MRGGLFTLVVVGLTLGAGLVLPQLRDFRLMVWQSSSSRQQDTPLPAAVKMAHYVSQHPGDSYLHLAQAELEAWRARQAEGGKKTSSEDFRALAKRFSDSSAINLRLALRLLAASGPGQRVEIWGPAKAFYAPPQRTPEQQENLVEAEHYLRTAARLDPANAAPQYLLAYVLFQQGKDPAAEQALKEAATRNHWSLYSREIRRANFELFEAGKFPAIYVPLYVASIEAQSQNEPPLRDLARLLAGLGERRRQGGDAAGALPYHSAAVHLGSVLLAGADTVADGLTAAGIISIASGNFVDQKETRLIKNARLSREQKISRLGEVRREHFRAYLIAQGAAALADQYARDYQRAEVFKAKSRQISLSLMAGVTQAFNNRYMTAAALCMICGIYALSLFLLAAIVALFAGVFKRQCEIPGWNWGEWFGLMALVFALGVGALWLSPSAPDAASSPALGEIYSIALLLLLLLFPLLGGLQKTRGEAFRPAKARLAGVLAGYRILMPPAFAVLLAAALVMLVLAQSPLQKWAAQEKQMVLQGEAQAGNLVPKE